MPDLDCSDRILEQWIRASTGETLAEYVAAYEESLARIGFIGGALPDWWQEVRQ